MLAGVLFYGKIAGRGRKAAATNRTNTKLDVGLADAYQCRIIPVLDVASCQTMLAIRSSSPCLETTYRTLLLMVKYRIIYQREMADSSSIRKYHWISAVIAAALLAPLPQLSSAVEEGSNPDLAGLSAGESTVAAAAQAYGDFNNDGFDDLAVGVAFENVGAVSDAGGVNVLYGTAGGISSSNDQFWTQNSAGIENSADPGDVFGWAVAAGDFDGDGFDDLAVGIPGEDVGGDLVAGAVAVIYGSGSGLSSAGDQFWTQGNAAIEDDEDSFDNFGRSLAVGDFDNDGFDDLAIGVPFESVGMIEDAGVVNVIYGSNSGLTGNGDQLWHQNSAGINDSAEDSDFFGSSLAAGDFDSDGFDDLAVGVPAEDIGTSSPADDCGAVNVIYGGNSGLTSTGDQIWHQGRPGIEDDEETFDQYGHSLASGDFDNDGFDDLAVGIPAEESGAIEDEGAVNVIYGTNAGLSSVGNQLWSQDSSGIADIGEELDSFGQSVAAGDFDGDGFDDLAIGVLEHVGTKGLAGAVNVLYGSGSGITASGDQIWHQDIAGVEDSAETSDQLGFSVATGDFNNDGRSDLAAGIPFEDVGAGPINNAGAVHVFYGSASGLSANGDQFWHQDSSGVEDSAEANDNFGWSVA
jgi:hypothetical protein